MVGTKQSGVVIPLNVKKIRADFPILAREVHPGIPLVYLDSAATSQKPEAVIEAMAEYYRKHNANIHRAVHTLAEEATSLYEGARAKVADWIGAERPQEIIFTRNATEAINLVAQSWGSTQLRSGDVVLLTEMEHHSNLVPWQILAEARNLRLEFVPLTGNGELDLAAYDKLLGQSPKLVALTQMSNVLGTINPIREIVRSAHRAGAKVLIDAAQSVPHMAVNVRELDADFLAFSAHKMCGPTGIGALYGKTDILREMPPFLGGGDMIRKVEWRSFEPNDLPYTFEAGTPAIAEAVGWGAAIDYLQAIGMPSIHQHEQDVTTYALRRLQEIHGLKISDRGLKNGEGWWPLRWKGFIRTTSRKFWIPSASRFGPATTARCPCIRNSTSRPPPGRRFTCIPFPMRST